MLLTSDTWTTPGGIRATLFFRENTSDWNTVNAIMGTNDEYKLASGMTGLLLDVGAHIGAWTIAAALDNPACQVVAIEALPENCEIIRENVSLNKVGDRVAVIEGAATCGTDPVTIAYGSTETEFARGHEFIGGGIWHDDAGDRKTIEAMPVTLEQFGSVRLLKIDCEGCEWQFLDTPAVAIVEEMTGEYHPRQGYGPARLRELLEKTHKVTLNDAEPFGLFTAVRR